MEKKEIIALLLGAGISFFSSIALLIVNKIFNERGKIKLYCKIFSTVNAVERYGFFATDSGITLILPLKIEAQNTSNTTRIIRNVGIILYNNGKRMFRLNQAEKSINRIMDNGITTKSNEQQYGSKINSYTYVIPPRSVVSEKCVFIYSLPLHLIPSSKFDEIKLSYFDEKDKEHLYSIRRIDNCWKCSDLVPDEDWVRVN